LHAEVLKHLLKDVVITDIVSDARETFEYISTYYYDLILMDISLKNGESGIEIMKKIKQIQNYSNVPIIALTAYTFDEDKNKFLSEGFDGFIPKPIRRDDLMREIKLYLNKRTILFV
ncbi:MAG: response regulator, partial [Ignavibacterium sp.]|nr:response regulator [Ignavibacterium sp.]